MEWGSFQIKFLSNSKQSAEINLHTGCKSSWTVLIKTAHRHKDENLSLSAVWSQKKVLTWWQVKKESQNGFLQFLNTADTFVFWGMIIQNNISLIWSIWQIFSIHLIWNVLAQSEFISKY